MVFQGVVPPSSGTLAPRGGTEPVKRIAEPRDRPPLYTSPTRTGNISIAFVCLWTAIHWVVAPYQRKSCAEASMLRGRLDVMTPATIVELGDVTGRPKVKMDLPPMRIGDRVQLRCRLARKNGGRNEVLDVVGEFRVTTTSLDASSGTARQLLVVESTGVAPAWRAVKKDSLPPPRRLGPARVRPMVIE